MSLIQRTPIRNDARRSGIGLSASLTFAALVFLWTLRFGVAPATAGLDPSWKEVLAWSYLHHAQWGHDLVFTYGPTGFLYPFANYVDGIFWPFVAGQIALTASFAVISAAMFRRHSVLSLCVFVLAFGISNGLVPGEVSWPLTLLFGTTVLVDSSLRQTRQGALALTGTALVFAVIALSKFSLLPVWLLCIACAACVIALDHSISRGVMVLCVCAGAGLLVWMACFQQLGILRDFLANASEIAGGYSHAMGMGAAEDKELAGAACVVAFVMLCFLSAWSNRYDPSKLLLPLLYSAAALWAWRAHFTRGDHAPYFFALMSLLPFGLLCSDRLDWNTARRVGLVAICLASTAANLFLSSTAPLWTRATQLITLPLDNLHHLMHLDELHAQRTTEWTTAQQQAALPEIRHRIGNSRVDMMGIEQGVILLNQLHYAPRPVFQSYSAYTPKLAKLNEAYFLGSQAPKFVVLQLAAIDARLPMSEDALALIALLRCYEPVMMEKGFLLLQRDESANTLPTKAPETWSPAQLKQELSVPDTGSKATVAFVKVDLTLMGKLYSLLLREPTLNIALQTNAGSRTYRFIRPIGVSGFVLSPMIDSVPDWAKVHLGMPVPTVRSFHVEAQVPWQNVLFDQSMQVAFEPLKIHKLESSASSTFLDGILPGFNDTPAAIHGISDLITENGHSAVFLHAPGQIEFRPAPGRYRISARYGIREATLIDHNCAAAKPDGIGVSIVLQHANSGETLLLHRELDPFHLPADQGMHEFVTDEVALVAGDTVEYRVDPGHGGNNTACDWSYVRDLKFEEALR